MLVSLISEQTIPNIVCAIHFKVQQNLFITTRRSEIDKKSEAIEEILIRRKIATSPNDFYKIEVNQDDFSDCVTKLREYLDKQNSDTEYIVNMTCGNKIMALAVYETFTKIGQKIIIGYIPLNTNNFIQLFPLKNPLIKDEIKERLRIEEYLLGCGFKIKNEETFFQTQNEALKNSKLTRWILENFDSLKNLFSFFYDKLRDKRRERKIDFKEKYLNKLKEEEREFLKKMNFNIENGEISAQIDKTKINFLTGGWLEEFVFAEINELVKEKIIDETKLSVQIESEAKNEIDVCLIKDNVFYHIECKSLTKDESENQIINDETYKKGMLTTKLGLGDKKRAIICTTLSKIKDSLKKRAEEYKIDVFTKEDTLRIKEIIKSKL